MVFVAVILANHCVKLFTRFKFPEKTGVVAYGFRNVVVLDEMRPSHVRSEVNPNVSGGNLCIELSVRQLKVVDAVTKACVEPLDWIYTTPEVGGLFFAVIPVT